MALQSSDCVYVIIFIVATFSVLQSYGVTLKCEVMVTTINKHQKHANHGAEESTECCGIRDSDTCESFNHALDHLTSGTIIHVTKNVKLSSISSLKSLAFVAIIGHNSPIVTCRNGGGLHFSACNNCSIEGITWDGCGADSKDDQPGILFYNSSNIRIQNCSFQHSVGQAVVLSEVSGHVSINHCKFVNNSHYRGHGAAIHYSSNVATSISELTFTMNYCNFSHNEVVPNSNIAATSILYIGKSSSHDTILISNSSFDNNKGNAMFVSKQNLHIEGTMVLERNTANNGAGLTAIDHSNVTFGKHSQVTFIKNKAIGNNNHGGAILLTGYSNIRFEQTSIVTLTGNKAKNGGAVYVYKNSSLLFDANSNIIFLNNSATNDGGAIDCHSESEIIFKSNSTVSFIGNSAKLGGAILSDAGSAIVFEGNATIKFINNIATENGGAIITHDNGTVLFKGNASVTLSSNQAVSGAGIMSSENCNITFAENSTVTFTNNNAYIGGAVQLQNHCNLIFEGNSTVTFDNNTAADGGGLYLHTVSDVIFKGNSYIAFYNNAAESRGGAVYSYGNSRSDITVMENAYLNFTHNVAETGGAIQATTCDVKFLGTSNVMFNNNEAVHEGGAICLNNQSNVIFDRYTNITLACNSATYGAGMYANLSENTFTFNATQFHYYNNTAKVAGSLIYVYIPASCNRSCIEKRIVGLNKTAKLVTTSPKKIELYKPAVPMCENSNSSTEKCGTYHISNVMLGQEVLINSCVIDHFDQPTDEAVQVLVTGASKDITPSSNYVQVSCGLPLKFHVTGRRTSVTDYSMTFSTFKLSTEDRKLIHVNVTVELTHCHPGFQFDPKSQMCECFGHNIVFCSGSNSTIQRGYWFGEVNNKSTVAFCPINYCDFAGCNSAINLCHLSPERTNQCRLHRSGTACGDCGKGYTLPFYSTECINEDNCTILQTAIVIVLTVVYWIVLVIAVFITMYYKVSIGYLYAITYYYSIVDILLSDYFYIPNGFYIIINAIYSIFKLIPQFLGKLCLVRGLSGIDQQFIHYIHPLAISLILVMIIVLARFSRRMSAFISRGIIGVICCFLLLSYTSITSTSLLLVRYLRFLDISKVYTYLSPDIEYFQGRHLAYGIIALLCIIFIVVGVPLLLIAEPFLKYKISFSRIKPFLDYFQRCYKEKYQWFAGYYMLCRIVIITVMITFSTNNVTYQYLLITICAAIFLIHISVRPYVSIILNAFDGLLLLLLVLVPVLLLVEFINSNSVIPITFALLFLPLIIFSTLCLFLNKDAIKKLFICLKCHARDYDNILESPAANDDVDLTVDDSMRMNATTCDVHLDIDSIKDANQN